jgi:hypothetical protein
MKIDLPICVAMHFCDINGPIKLLTRSMHMPDTPFRRQNGDRNSGKRAARVGQTGCALGWRVSCGTDGLRRFEETLHTCCRGDSQEAVPENTHDVRNACQCRPEEMGA